MGPEDRSVFHQAMEQQEISINKATINATLPTRCSILAAANPVNQRFDVNETFLTQVGLEPTIVSRFDLIWVIIDDKNDDGLLDFILEEKGDIRDESLISIELLQKWIVHARKTCNPVRTTESNKIIRDFVLKLRHDSRSDVVQANARHYRGILRLAEASARARLSDTVDEVDAMRAMSLYGRSMSKMCFEEDGLLNPDKLIGGGRRRGGLNMFRDIMRDLKGGTIEREVLMTRLIAGGNKQNAAEDMIKKMLDDGEIFEPHQGKYQAVRG
jgi:replicative DNA helicase Mcm